MRASLALLTSIALLVPGCPGDTDKDAQPCQGAAGTADVCDGVDNDCDGEMDEDAPVSLWYADQDGDGFGGAEDSVSACEPPEGYKDASDDCDDDDSTISPDASEVCGGQDEDCDGLTDDDDPSVSGLTSWFLDEDGDGFGAGPSFRFCDQPDGYVDNSIDCDDSDETVLDSLVWYADQDADGYGDLGSTTTSCETPDGYVDNALDCDDLAGDVSPGLDEVCLDDRDNDCDGTDNGCVPLEGELSIDDAGALLSGANSYFGSSLRSADTDGDGLPELVTSAPYASSNTGTVYLLEGLESGGSGTESLATGQVFGSSDHGYLGFGIADGADYDGDGYDDLAIFSAGSSYVLGVDGPISEGDSVDRASFGLYGLSGSSSLNRRWITGADLDSDGAASLLVGDAYYTSSYTYEGLVYVVQDPLSLGEQKLGAVAAATIYANAEYAYLGQEIARLGDLDGDGLEEIGLGSYYYSYGYSYNGLLGIFSGDLSGTVALTSADLLIFGSAAYQYSGGEIASAGDIDGDGRDDLALNAYYDASFTGSSVGAAYVFLSPPGAGSVSTARADVAFYSTASSSRFAQQLAGADLNGDGASDLVAGDYSDDSNYGSAYLFYGPLDSGSYADSVADAHIGGSSSRSYLGYDVASPGDLDLDGYEELAINVYGETSVGVFFGGSY